MCDGFCAFVTCQTVATNRAFYIRRGVYLLVEKLESLVFRTFVKRVYVMAGHGCGTWKFMCDVVCAGC